MRADGGGDVARHHVGVHVVEAAVLAQRHRSHDGDVVAGNEVVQKRAVDARDAAHASQLRAGLFGHDDARVGAADAHGEVAVLVESLHQLLVHFAHQHGAHEVHGLGRGDALTVLELHGKLQEIHGLGDGLAAAVHDDGIHADDLQQHDVVHDVGAQLLVDHGRAAVLDDDGLTGDVLDPGKGLDEHFRGLVRYAFRARVLCVLHER